MQKAFWTEQRNMNTAKSQFKKLLIYATTTVKASKGANKKLIWKSSNTKYATVSSFGKIKTKKTGKKKTVKIKIK